MRGTVGGEQIDIGDVSFSNTNVPSPVVTEGDHSLSPEPVVNRVRSGRPSASSGTSGSATSSSSSSATTSKATSSALGSDVFASADTKNKNRALQAMELGDDDARADVRSNSADSNKFNTHKTGTLNDLLNPNLNPGIRRFVGDNKEMFEQPQQQRTPLVDAHELRFDPEREMANTRRPAAVDKSSSSDPSKGTSQSKSKESEGSASNEGYGAIKEAKMVNTYGNDLFGELDMNKYDVNRKQQPALLANAKALQASQQKSSALLELIKRR